MRSLSRDNRPVVFMATRYTTGGATLNARMLAEQFAARGIATELWCLYRSAEMAKCEVPVRVMLERVPRSPLALARMVRNLREHLERIDPCALVGFHPLANVLGALTATPRRRFIATQRNPAQSQSALLQAADAVLGATQRYHANIAVSHAVKASYARYAPAYLSKLTVIPNGLPSLIEIDEDKRAARVALGLPQDGMLVGNIGRLHPQKAPDFLLEVAERTPQATFVLAGEGPLADTIANDVRTRGLNVILPGRLDGVDITRLLRSLDLFLFPSRFEGFGRALLEAMSQGLRVIAHDMPVTREVLGPHGHFLPLEAASWSDCIRQQISEGGAIEQRAALIARAHGFSLAAMVDRYAEAIFGPAWSIHSHAGARDQLAAA